MRRKRRRIRRSGFVHRRREAIADADIIDAASAAFREGFSLLAPRLRRGHGRGQSVQEAVSSVAVVGGDGPRRPGGRGRRHSLEISFNVDPPTRQTEKE